MKPLKVRVKGTDTSFREVTGFEIGNHLLLRAELVEFEEEPTSDNNINWQQIRVNAAIAVLQGLLANPALFDKGEPITVDIEHLATAYADCLIEELKK